MKFGSAIFVAVMLGACQPTGPAQISSSQQQIINACEAGDLDACKFIETAKANAQAQRAANWNAYQAAQAAQPTLTETYNSFGTLNPRPVGPTTTTSCQRIGYQVVCNSY
jgi:hypothetical protein